MKPAICGGLLLALWVGVAAGADQKSQLAGKWKLDRKATLELYRDSGGKAETLPEFDIELELRDDGDAQYVTTVAGTQEAKKVEWQVIEPESGEGKSLLELVPSIGTPKRHTIERLEKDVLELRPQGAKHTLVLRREAK